MKFMKRAAVAAVLLLAPVQASAGQAVIDVMKDAMHVIGETHGYMESCKPSADRSSFRRAHFLEAIEQTFTDNAVRLISLSWDLGRVQGLTATCGQKQFVALLDRGMTAMDDAMNGLKRALAAQEAKAAKK